MKKTKPLRTRGCRPILLTIDGKTIFHAGDTALFSDMKLIGELNHIDLAFLPIGDNFTMGPEDAKLAAEWLRAKQVVPVHYNTFPVIEQDPDAFAESLPEASAKSWRSARPLSLPDICVKDLLNQAFRRSFCDAAFFRASHCE